MKTTIRLFTTVLLFLSVSLAAPNARAVIPPPDGGYPNFNTAEGQNALFSLTTGAANTAVGWFSLWGNTAGSFNTATGAGALLFNTAEENTAFGAAALLFNTTGVNNTAFGTAALLNNTTASRNTATGFQALVSNTTGEDNTATGNAALLGNTTGIQNTSTGAGALFINTTGSQNTANGYQALFSNTTGLFNTAVGQRALQNNTTGNLNTALGERALQANTTGNFNTALGIGAGFSATGSNNVYIGAFSDGVAGESDVCYIVNIFGGTSANGIPVLINSGNKLGTTTSSKRFKQEIKAMDKASEALFALKPVSFRYKKEIDPAGTSQLGLVAEEVEKVNPDLVVRDKEGKPYSVRYDQVNAMLLNEFLKEHRKVEKLEATVADLAAKLQQVSAQVQMNSSVAKVAGK